ncbi:DUF4269 domain-containing protein [Flammeovirga pacifica]|uniref:Diadenosine tetraphosphate hydrolase n=1 Tax=Flammeovirga pacifica TaxID=915059 RepID=A0A1S1YYU5_FLAPC|nr:DUF4269 domain-containing protein [Flammeovirga pacifica]OHX66045.1 hypothetical protein NH26_06620 [Flammeovirga pacifica]
MRDFIDISYLKEGSSIQQFSYRLLKEVDLFSILMKYHPILTGTIPIGIDVEGSDLDIICEVSDFSEFHQIIEKNYAHHDDYSYSGIQIRNQKEYVTYSFFVKGMQIEIFAENKPTNEQNAYRHMLIEHYFLGLKGEDFKKEIIALKADGLKTEPAFAKLLELEGDPYLELLKFWDNIQQ